MCAWRSAARPRTWTRRRPGAGRRARRRQCDLHPHDFATAAARPVVRPARGAGRDQEQAPATLGVEVGAGGHGRGLDSVPHLDQQVPTRGGQADRDHLPAGLTPAGLTPAARARIRTHAGAAGCTHAGAAGCTHAGGGGGLDAVGDEFRDHQLQGIGHLAEAPPPGERACVAPGVADRRSRGLVTADGHSHAGRVAPAHPRPRRPCARGVDPAGRFRRRAATAVVDLFGRRPVNRGRRVPGCV
jgi:hypothetical protein